MANDRTSPPHLLIIEDEDEVRAMLALCLTPYVSSLKAVATAAEARRLLGSGYVPDAVVSDLRVGSGVDGIQILGWARDRFPASRRVLMSGRVSPRLEAEALEGGAAHAVLRKPFSPDRLMTALGLVA